MIHDSFKLPHLLRVSRHRSSWLNNRASKSLKFVLRTCSKGAQVRGGLTLKTLRMCHWLKEWIKSDTKETHSVFKEKVQKKRVFRKYNLWHQVVGWPGCSVTNSGPFLTEKDKWRFCAQVWGFPDSSVGKESARNAGDLGLIPELGRSPGEGQSCPVPRDLQYFGLESYMDCVVMRSQRVRHDWATFTFYKEPHTQLSFSQGGWSCV